MDNTGWFVTFEMPKVTALLVQKDKDKKHFTELVNLPNGNCVVKYRGLTDKEKEAKKKQDKLNKDLLKSKSV